MEILKKHEEIIAKNFSGLVGKVLTQIEASTGDATQRKSLKKIIEGQIYDCRNEILVELDQCLNVNKYPHETGVGVDTKSVE